MAKKAKIKKRGIFEVFKNLSTYLNLVFLLLLFPLGIISFIITLLFLAFSISLILTPVLALFGPMTIAGWEVPSLIIKLVISLILCIVGIFLLTLGLYITNGIAYLYKKLFRLF